jgi:hypothetical protein
VVSSRWNACRDLDKFTARNSALDDPLYLAAVAIWTADASA